MQKRMVLGGIMRHIILYESVFSVDILNFGYKTKEK